MTACLTKLILLLPALFESRFYDINCVGLRYVYNNAYIINKYNIYHN